MRIFSYEELDELGEGLIRQYLGKEAERTCCVDIEGFVTDFLKLPLLYRSFAEEDSDKIGFIADGVTPLRVYEGGTVVRRVYPRGTIVIERCLRQEHESGRRRFTISHECAHYIMDRAVPSAAFHREFDGERAYTQEDFKNLFSFRETQVDRMGAALLMPRFMVRNVAAMHGCTDRIPVYGDSIAVLSGYTGRRGPHPRIWGQHSADGGQAPDQTDGQRHGRVLLRLSHSPPGAGLPVLPPAGGVHHGGNGAGTGRWHRMRKASAPRKLSPDVSRRLSDSRRESAALTLREIHCPFCSFLVEKVFSDAAGHKMVYCRKCKSEYPINLGCFRRIKAKQAVCRLLSGKPRQKR